MFERIVIFIVSLVLMFFGTILISNWFHFNNDVVPYVMFIGAMIFATLVTIYYDLRKILKSKE